MNAYQENVSLYNYNNSAVKFYRSVNITESICFDYIFAHVPVIYSEIIIQKESWKVVASLALLVLVVCITFRLLNNVYINYHSIL